MTNPRSPERRSRSCFRVAALLYAFDLITYDSLVSDSTTEEEGKVPTGRIFDPSLQSGIGRGSTNPEYVSLIEVLFFAFYLNSIQTDIGTVGLEFALRDGLVAYSSLPQPQL